MKEKVGELFSIAKENEAIAGCTVSKAIYDGKNLSPQLFPTHKAFLCDIILIENFRRKL